MVRAARSRQRRLEKVRHLMEKAHMYLLQAVFQSLIRINLDHLQEHHWPSSTMRRLRQPSMLTLVQYPMDNSSPWLAWLLHSSTHSSSLALKYRIHARGVISNSGGIGRCLSKIGIRTATMMMSKRIQQPGGERWSSRASVLTSRARAPRVQETVELAVLDEHRAGSSLMERKVERPPIRIQVASQ